MSYANPTVPIISNPSGIDIPIEAARKRLKDNLNWLEKSFGRSFISVENDNRMPFIYSENGEYIPLYFNDNLSAMSWFNCGNESPTNYQRDTQNPYERDASLYFWVNLEKIDVATYPTYYFVERLVEDVKRVFAKSMKGVSIAITDIIVNQDEVFSEYSYSQDADKQFFRAPYAGFRFDLIIRYFQEC